MIFLSGPQLPEVWAVFGLRALGRRECGANCCRHYRVLLAQAEEGPYPARRDAWAASPTCAVLSQALGVGSSDIA